MTGVPVKIYFDAWQYIPKKERKEKRIQQIQSDRSSGTSVGYIFVVVLLDNAYVTGGSRPAL